MVNKKNYLGITTLMVLLFFADSVQSSEFRSFRPILTPAAISGDGGTAGKRIIKPVSRNLAAKAMDKIIKAWNVNTLYTVLGDNFFDKSRLSDAMNSKVPRDARLELLAIQDVQTLQQQMTDSPGGHFMTSMVSITVKTQLTFNDPINGYQRREGVNEYIVNIKQRASN